MEKPCTSLASLLGILASLLSILWVVFPPQLRFASLKFLNRALNYFSSYCYIDITEIDGVNTNVLYNAVQLYLSSYVSASTSASRLSLTRAVNSSATIFGLSNYDCINDVFNGVAVQWEHMVMQRQSQNFSWRPLPDEKRSFMLRIKKGNKDLILHCYLDHIMDKANKICLQTSPGLLSGSSFADPIPSPAQATVAPSLLLRSSMF